MEKFKEDLQDLETQKQKVEQLLKGKQEELDRKEQEVAQLQEKMREKDREITAKEERLEDRFVLFSSSRTGNIAVRRGFVKNLFSLENSGNSPLEKTKFSFNFRPIRVHEKPSFRYVPCMFFANLCVCVCARALVRACDTMTS